MTIRVGVISDTHGLLRPEVPRALAGVDLIVHAGDVGRAEILDELREVAPLVAIRGNVDRTGAVAALPPTAAHEVESVWLYVLHDLHTLDLSPAAAGFGVVISGHTHAPRLEVRGGVTYLNPGSVGPRRFRLPVGLAFLTIDADRVTAELVELSV